LKVTVGKGAFEEKTDLRRAFAYIIPRATERDGRSGGTKDEPLRFPRWRPLKPKRDSARMEGGRFGTRPNPDPIEGGPAAREKS